MLVGTMLLDPGTLYILDSLCNRPLSRLGNIRPCLGGGPGGTTSIMNDEHSSEWDQSV